MPNEYREITKAELAAVVADIKAMNLDDPKNHLSAEEFLEGSEDTTQQAKDRVVTIARK